MAETRRNETDREMSRSTMGEYIRFLRLQKGLTQRALADMLHVTDKAVSKWERDLSFPDILLLPKMADILGVSVGELLRESDREGSPARLFRQYRKSSDLRAPLHIILGCAELLESCPQDEERCRRYLESIRISGEYLLSVFERQAAGSGPDGQEPGDAADPGKGDSVDKGPGSPDGGRRTLEDLLEEQRVKRTKAARLYDFTGCRILIAEDIAVNREIAGEILKQTGAALEYAEDGMTCVDMVEEKPPGYYDLILMDVMMPNMDGIEAARYIRGLSDPAKAGIPIITMTANVSEEDRRAAFEAGMDAFAEKPIFIEDLLGTMKEFI